MDIQCVEKNTYEWEGCVQSKYPLPRGELRGTSRRHCRFWVEMLMAVKKMCLILDFPPTNFLKPLALLVAYLDSSN